MPSQTNQTPDTQKLLTLDFVLLFFLALFSNCYLAVYYCFEQWLVKVAVDPHWRGLLLGILFGTLLVARPCAIVFLLKRNKLPVVIASLLVSSGVLFSYQYLDPSSPLFEWTLLGLRILQGTFLALFSTSVVSVLVSCIPPGQSARGFALFSITFLLPYGIIPSLGEYLLTVVGDEPHLYALTGLLLIPCLIMTGLLAPRLKKPELTQRRHTDFRQYVGRLALGVTHSGLGLVYASMVSFSIGTSTCIFFIKGLCTLTGGNPASFFFFYTMTIILVRVFGSRHLDRLPCYRIVPIVACTMALGTGLGGRRIVEKIGHELAHLTPTQGLAADLATGVVLGVCSLLGLPVSTSHAKVAAICGASPRPQPRVVAQLGLVWVLTFPACMGLGYGLALLLR